MDNILDHVVVQGQRYDIVSPTAFGDNIETIGSACINPDGYAQGSTFLARLGNEQFYYEATAAITQGSTILEGTNCKKTTVTGREAELASEIETLGETVDSLNEALSNEVTTRAKLGAHNLLDVSSGTLTNCSLANNGFTNTNADTRDYFNFALKALDSSSTLIRLMANQSITNAGEFSFDITIPANTAYILLQHVGSTRNIQISVPSSLEAGNYTFSFKVQSANPTTVGGLDVRNIMLRLSTDSNPTYQPYAMTNKELTKTLTTKSSQAISTYLTAKRYGKIVNIQGFISVANSDLTVGTDYQIGTLNSEFRPGNAFAVPVSVTAYSGTTLDYKPARFYVGANGALIVNPAELSVLTTTTFQINCTYLVD